MADTVVPRVRSPPPDDSPCLGSVLPVGPGAPLEAPQAGGRPYPRSGVPKSPRGFLDRPPGLPGEPAHSPLLFSGYAHFLTPR